MLKSFVSLLALLCMTTAGLGQAALGQAGLGQAGLGQAGLGQAGLGHGGSRPELPGIKADKEFDALMKSIDLEQPSWDFIYKSGKHEGSSIGFHVAAAGHRKSATFMPYNNSNDLEGEVVSYRLARFLGISDLYNPVTYYQLGARGTARFKAMLAAHKETDPDRRVNYARIVAQLNKNPNTILGTYRQRPKGDFFRVFSFGYGFKLNTRTRMAGLIRADGPMPTDRLITLPGVKGQRPEYPKPFETESEIARQLSIILVVDQLMGQWDRFWRNLEAVGDQDGRLRLFSRDNGGAEVGEGWEWFSQYQAWVTRYDRDQIQKLKALDDFLQGRAKRIGEFQTVEAWRSVLGFQKVGSFNTFKRKLALFTKRLPQLEQQYGAKAYFEARKPEPGKTDQPSPAGPMAMAPRSAPAILAGQAFNATETSQCQRACDVASQYSHAEPEDVGKPPRTPRECLQWVVIRLTEQHPQIGAFPISDVLAARAQEATAEQNIDKICAAETIREKAKSVRECRSACAQP